MRHPTDVLSVLALLSSVLTFPCALSAKVIYVDDDAAGANDGTSWVDAYDYLQDALADANNSPKPLEIRVARGTYKPDQGAKQTLGDRSCTFQLVDGMTLKGGYAGFGEPDPNGRDVEAYETILSGDVKGDDGPLPYRNKIDNSFHVLTAQGSCQTAVLDGFSITGGNAVSSCPLYESGGGMYCTGSPIVINCRFNYNVAASGGGAMCNLGGNPTVGNCWFTGNTAYRGGGMYNEDSRATLTQCTFSGNLVWLDGGGVCNKSSSPTLANCTFSGNTADCYGGGMSNGDNSRPILNNCTLNKNRAAFGGGMYNANSSPTLTNCTLNGNSAEFRPNPLNILPGYGGGMCNSNSSPVLTNCTVSGNRAVMACGGIAGNTTLTNCILWANKPEQICLGAAVLTYSNAEGGWPGEGNIDADPCFVDPGRWVNANDPNRPAEPTDPNAIWIGGDYHLKSQAGRWDPKTQRWVRDNVTSPCIDAGDPNSNWTAELWPHGKRINMGAYGGTPQASMSLSVAGNIADLDHNDIVDANDLAVLAGAWLVQGVLLAQDLNHDAVVDFRDFAKLAASWRTHVGSEREPFEISLGSRAKWSQQYEGYDSSLPGYHIVGDIASVTLRARTDSPPDMLVLAIRTSPGMPPMLENLTFAAPCVMLTGEPFKGAELDYFTRENSSMQWHNAGKVQTGTYFTLDVVGDEVRVTFLPAAIELLRVECKISWIDWYR